MSSIIGQIKPEHPELFALELEKIAESDFVYTLAWLCFWFKSLYLIKILETERVSLQKIR